MEVRHKGWGQFMRRSEWRGEVTVRVVFFDDDVRTVDGASPRRGKKRGSRLRHRGPPSVPDSKPAGRAFLRIFVV